MAKKSTKTKSPSTADRIAALAPAWKDGAFAAALETPGKGGRSIEIEDIYELHLAGNPQVSPDGSKIVYEVQTIDKESDEYRSTLWLIDGDAEPRKLTSGRWKDTSPAFSPDGNKLAFTSNRNETSQIFVMPIDGGEAEAVTEIESGVGQFVWSPDSTKFAFTSRIAPEKEGDSDVKVITSAYYKFDGMGFIDDKASHIFIVDIASGKHEQLTDGAFNHGQIAFAPNGYEIAFIANRNTDWDTSRVADLWTMDIHSKQMRLLSDGKGYWRSPAYSPSGRWLAVLGDTDAHSENVNAGLYVLPANGGDFTRLGKDLDRAIGDTNLSGHNAASGMTINWTPDNKAIDAIVSDCGSTHIVRFPRNGKKPTVLTPGGRHIRGFQHMGDDFVIAAAQPTRPLEISRLSSAGEQRLSHHNDAWEESVNMPQSEEIWFESGDEMIQGWLMRPKGNSAKSKKKVPLILNIHGGPHAQFGPGFFHELQMYAARGYAVVYINPRGSTGRTNAFGKAVNAKWGFADMPDFMAAVDHALSLGGFDETRLGVTGGSYGGFSTNWILGHTDRFKAAVTDRTISNMASMYGTDDISLTSFDKALGTPWDNPLGYWEASPLAYVHKVTTPCLIIHSEEDYRCPMEQAEQWYMALKSLGRITELVRFPGESHGLGSYGKPKHRVERLQRTLAWFEKYL